VGHEGMFYRRTTTSIPIPVNRRPFHHNTVMAQYVVTTKCRAEGGRQRVGEEVTRNAGGRGGERGRNGGGKEGRDV